MKPWKCREPFYPRRESSTVHMHCVQIQMWARYELVIRKEWGLGYTGWLSAV